MSSLISKSRNYTVINRSGLKAFLRLEQRKGRVSDAVVKRGEEPYCEADQTIHHFPNGLCTNTVLLYLPVNC